MQCPICSEPVAAPERFCSACDAGLAWAADGSVGSSFPELTPGNVIISATFDTSPLPGRRSMHERREGVFEGEPVACGLQATYHQPMTGAFVDYDLQFRDACVRATFTPLDVGARIGLVARHSMIGDVQLYYLFDCVPGNDSAWCARAIQFPADATSTVLSPQRVSSMVPTGQPIELAMRVAGPTIHAYIDGVLVSSVHDASFGQGSFGIRVGREHDVCHPVRVLCHGYEIREVAP